MKKQPLLANAFTLPTKKNIDIKLIVGSAMFGIGWGLAGFCPAPAIASLAFGIKSSAIFILTMILGMFIFKSIQPKET